MSFGHVCLCMVAFESVCDVVNCQKRKFKTDRVTPAAVMAYKVFLNLTLSDSKRLMSDFSLCSCRCVIIPSVRNWTVKAPFTCASHVILAVTWMSLTACTLTGIFASTYSHKVNGPAHLMSPSASYKWVSFKNSRNGCLVICITNNYQ